MEIKNWQAAEIAVVMVPLPAQGHLNQLLHLSRLISSYKIPVHYVGTTTHNRQARLRVQNWDPAADSNLHFHDFSLPPFETPPPNPDSPDKFPSQIIPLLFATSHLRHPLGDFVRELCGTARRVVVVYDSAMAWVVQDIPSLPNAECYLFNSVSILQIYTYFLEAAGKAFPADGPQILKEIPSLDGCFPDEFWDYWHIQEKFLGNSCGCLHNTSRVIEGPFLDLFEKDEALGSLKQWAIGPFNPVAIPKQRDSDDKRRHECLDWLDNQPRNAVVFVSFGTTTTLSDQQIRELASGLEKSGQKFVWVLRDADNANIFAGNDTASGGRRADQLPQGYEERVRGRGIIIRDWAPQLEILAHPATGGFMTHCGWNSCMESMSMGVPMAAWPMHSDQPRNSVLIAKFLGIGLLVRDWVRRQEVVTSTAIEHCVVRLMASEEGEEMRRKAADLSGAIKRSVMDGGVTREELDSFIVHITR